MHSKSKSWGMEVPANTRARVRGPTCSTNTQRGTTRSPPIIPQRSGLDSISTPCQPCLMSRWVLEAINPSQAPTSHNHSFLLPILRKISSNTPSSPFSLVKFHLKSLRYLLLKTQPPFGNDVTTIHRRSWTKPSLRRHNDAF